MTVRLKSHIPLKLDLGDGQFLKLGAKRLTFGEASELKKQFRAATEAVRASVKQEAKAEEAEQLWKTLVDEVFENYLRIDSEIVIEFLDGDQKLRKPAEILEFLGGDQSMVGRIVGGVVFQSEIDDSEDAEAAWVSASGHMKSNGHSVDVFSDLVGRHYASVHPPGAKPEKDSRPGPKKVYRSVCRDCGWTWRAWGSESAAAVVEPEKSAETEEKKLPPPSPSPTDSSPSSGEQRPEVPGPRPEPTAESAGPGGSANSEGATSGVNLPSGSMAPTTRTDAPSSSSTNAPLSP